MKGLAASHADVLLAHHAILRNLLREGTRDETVSLRTRQFSLFSFVFRKV